MGDNVPTPETTPQATPDPEVVRQSADLVADAVKSMKSEIMAAHKEAFDIHANTVKKAERRERLDLDVRGIIAMMTLLLAFGLAFLQFLITRNLADYPTWAAAVTTGIVGFYFG